MTKTLTPLSHQPDKPVQRQQPDDLHTELMALSYHGFAFCMRHLLTMMGYSAPHMMGRTQWRQRTRNGGVDLEAFTHTGLTHGRVVVQLKQYVRPVHRRFVDELRGTMLRVGARHGILITTSTFAKAARKAAEEMNLSGVAPIRLIDGVNLVRLLAKHGVGVKPVKPLKPSDEDELLYTLYHGRSQEEDERIRGEYQVDEEYFVRIRERFPAKAVSPAPSCAECNPDTNPNR